MERAEERSRWSEGFWASSDIFRVSIARRARASTVSRRIMRAVYSVHEPSASTVAARYWCHLESDSFRNNRSLPRKRESVRQRLVSHGFRSRFPPSRESTALWSARIPQRTPVPAPSILRPQVPSWCNSPVSVPSHFGPPSAAENSRLGFDVIETAARSGQEAGFNAKSLSY